MSHRRAAPHPHPHPDHFHLHPLLIQLPFSSNNRGSFNSCQASSGTPTTESQRPISHHRNPTELKLRTEPRDAFDLKPAKWRGVQGYPGYPRGQGARFRTAKYLNSRSSARFTGSPCLTCFFASFVVLPSHFLRWSTRNIVLLVYILYTFYVISLASIF